MSAMCEGKCGKTVTEAGKWCSSCFFEPDPVGPPSDKDLVFGIPDPKQTMPKSDLRQIRMDIWHASYKLALGTKAEQAGALETIALLVSALQQEQHQTKKET